MRSFQEILSNIQTSTRPPKHMEDGRSTGELEKVPKTISLERLIEACIAAGRDPHAVIAAALTDEARDQREETGMTLREQARLSWQIIDKGTPSLQAIKHSGDKDNPVAITFSKADEDL